MIFFSDPQETASRFGDYIHDLHDVFRCHGVDFGSPEEFFAFARTVKYHSELRGDVLRVVKSVMESETNISFRTILTIIAVASGGPDVGTFDREMSTPVHQVIESLIGVGTSRKLDGDQPDSSRRRRPEFSLWIHPRLAMERRRDTQTRWNTRTSLGTQKG